MKRLLVATLALAFVSACGGNKTCADVAKKVNDCLASLGQPPIADLQAQCDAATCTDKQKAIDCVVDQQCLDILSGAIVTTCITPNGCTGITF